jgi:hypothetical protein
MMVSLAAGGEASFCEANQPSLGRFCSISSVSDSEAQGPGAANAMCVTGTGKKTPGIPVKRHRGEPGHTRDTRDTRTHGTRGRTKAHGPHRRTSQPSKPTNNTHPARQRDDRSRGRLNSRRPGADRALPVQDAKPSPPLTRIRQTSGHVGTAQSYAEVNAT